MRKVLWLLLLFAVAALAVCVALFMPLPEATAHATWPDYTTDTLTTSDTLQPQYMIEWVRVLDDIQETQAALRSSIAAQARIMADPESDDGARALATRRAVRAQCNIEALDGLLWKISQHDVLELDPDARGYGVWKKNPLKE